jgi:hypothetical protein
MINDAILKRAIVVVFSTATLTGTGIAYAFDFCNTTNPSKWSGDYRDRDDYYGDPGVDSSYGYRRSRGYGYGSPGYGYGAAPGYGYTALQPGSDALQAEIDQLKQRVKSLEKALTRESFRPQGAPTDPGTG